MISQDFRPRVFSEVAGHELVVKTLECIVKNPQQAPRSIILQGEFGTGKTTCSRILARALNCKNPKSNGDACGQCSICTGDIDASMFYEEYDSAMVGNVDSIKELRQSFFFNNELGWKVVVFDEAHLMSKTAQSALLKVLEEVTDNIFFVFATTDIEKVLPTIRSRSLELRFSLVDEEAIVDNLYSILYKKSLVSAPVQDPETKRLVYSLEDRQKYEAIVRIIARRSLGHMRNAHMLLDQYFLLGDEFLKSVRTSKDLFIKLIVCSIMWSPDGISKLIYELQQFSLVNLKVDYENLVLDIMKSGICKIPTKDTMLQQLLNHIGEKVIYLFDIMNRETIYRMFNSDKQFQIAMYLLASDIRKKFS